MKKFYLLLCIAALLFIGNNLYSQTHFKPVGDFTTAMSINILEAKVNGVNLVAGDEIGIFDGNVCVGIAVLTKSLGTLSDGNIAASKAGADDGDTPAKDGYVEGNTISFKMYDTSEDEEIPLVVATFVSSVDLSVISPSPTYDPDVTGFVSLIATHNYKPKAKAGDDWSIDEKLPGGLDGSASTDLEGSTLTYSWNDIDNIGLSALNVEKPTFTAPTVNVDTEYRVALTVNDGEKDSKPDTVIITVKQVNLKPVANAGTDFEIPELDAGELDGSGSSDPDGLDLTYSWVIEPADFTPATPDAATTDFTAPTVTNDVEYKAILTVTNTVLLSDKDTVIVKVLNYNLKPIANAGTDVEKDEGVNVTLDGSGSNDPDTAPNPVLTFSWTSVQGVAINNATTDSPDFDTPFYLKDSVLQFILVVNDGGINSDPDTVEVKVNHKNLEPIANAGGDVEKDEGVNVTLDGSASSDPDNGPNTDLTYSWTSVQGLAINNPNSVSPDFDTPFYLKDSLLKFVLVVNDGDLNSKTDTVTVLVKHKNLPPVADAGTDVEKDEGVNVILDGSASSDPDSAPNPVLTYAWTSVEGITLNNATTASPDFDTPLLLKDSVLHFVLIVNDGEDDSETDTVAVTVKHKNLPPTADAGADFSADENTLVQLDGSGSGDLDGTITYAWTATGITITGDDLVDPTFTAPEVQADSTITFTLTVTDNNLETDIATVDVLIKQVNKKPVADAGADQGVDENIEITLDGSNSYDPDMFDNITFKWIEPVGITLDDVTSETPKFTSPTIIEKFIDYTFKLVVNDGDIDSDTSSIVVRVIHLNLPPIADGGSDFDIDENTQGTLDGSNSSDPENEAITYSWTAPAGFTIDNPTSEVTTFTAPEVELTTVFDIVLVVKDELRSSDPYTVKVTVNHINKQPVAMAGSDQTVDENVLVQLDGTSSSDDDALDNITYLWTSLDGAVLDDVTSDTPSFTTPWLLQDKIYAFVLVVNDGIVDSETDTVKISVIHANLQPIADAGATTIVLNENSSSNLDGSGSSDPEGKTLTYLWTVPAGFVIDDPNVAATSFTAPEVEENTDFNITLTVDDGESTLNTDVATIVVTVVQVNKPPVAVAGDDFSIREQKLVMLDGSASNDPDALDEITYSWTAPAGVNLDDITSPTPSFTGDDVAVDTELTFELTVTDKSLATATDEIKVTITANKAPVADAGSNQTVNAKNTVTLHGENSSDPDGDGLTYSWTAPAGITLTNPTSANPTFVAPENENEESFIFTLEVTDELGLTNSKDVTVTVVSNLPPEIITELVVYVMEGKKASLDASKTTDPDGDFMSFDWYHYNPSYINVVELTNSKTPVVSFIAPMVDKQTYMPIGLKVNDGTEDSYVTVKVYVKDNSAPMAKAGDDVEILEGDTVQLDGSASSDLDGDPITYLWSSGYLVLDDVTAMKPSFIAPQTVADTTVLVTLVVNDGKLNSVPDTVMITVKHINVMPVANAGMDMIVNGGDNAMLDGSASSDMEGDMLTYLWSSDYLVLDDTSSEKPEFVAPELGADTTVWVTLVVNDGNLSSTPDTVMITVKRVNNMPVASAGADITVNEGEMITLDGSASSDPDGDEITFSWSAFGITLPGNDFISITLPAPDVEKDAMIPVVLVVNDGELNSVPDTVWVKILQVNKMPEWGEVPSDTAFVGYKYSAAISVTDPDMVDVISIFSDDLPAWLVLTDNGDGTAELSSDSIPRMEDLIGEHMFVIKAYDGTGTIEVTITLTITVQTGIEDVILSAVKFYPNPTNGLLNVEFNSLPEMGTTIQVYNQLGQIILIKQANSQTNQLNLSNNPAGLYYVKVTSEKASRTEKVILR